MSKAYEELAHRAAQIDASENPVDIPTELHSEDIEARFIAIEDRLAALEEASEL